MPRYGRVSSVVIRLSLEEPTAFALKYLEVTAVSRAAAFPRSPQRGSTALFTGAANQ